MPLESELEAERASWATNNASGAYGSNLKIPVAGDRRFSDGALTGAGSIALLWSRSANGTDEGRGFLVNSGNSGSAYFISSDRAYGFSVRCIKD